MEHFTMTCSTSWVVVKPPTFTIQLPSYIDGLDDSVMSTENGSFFAPNHSPTLADLDSAHSGAPESQQIPYKGRRQPWHRVHGFTYLLAAQKKPRAADIYTRSMILHGHGMALWSPFGYFPRGEEHIVKGVGIGDVGIIDHTGNFMFMFNIFRDSDDPIHRGSTPREFHPLVPPLDSSEVSYTPDFFKPGTAIVSDSIRVKRYARDPLKMKFYCKDQEGAILYLRHGASREDLISTDRLHQYVQHNAPHWYQMLNCYISGNYPNGSLVIVTGCDKASDWANAIFNGKGKLKYIWSEQFESPWYGDDRSRGQCFQPFPEYLCGVKIPVDVSSRHQCVFIRTLRVSLGSDLWMSIMRNAITPPFYSTIAIRRSPFQRLADAFMARLDLFYAEEKALRIILGRATGEQSFHPNDILAQVLLEQFPNADTCLLADSTWSSCVCGGIGTVSNIIELVDRVLARHKAVVIYGCLTLVPVNSEPGHLRSLVKCFRKAFSFGPKPQVQIIHANRLKYGLAER